MHVAPSSSEEQLRRARRCLEGDGTALAELRAQCHGPLLGILRTRGASATEADDILADLWSDCVRQPGERPSLLEKFSGRTPLLSWLATVATNRWVDVKRRQARSVPTLSDGSEALEAAAANRSRGVASLRRTWQPSSPACFPAAPPSPRSTPKPSSSNLRHPGRTRKALERFLKNFCKM